MTNQPNNYNGVLGSGLEVHGALIAQLDLMVRARYPLLYIVSVEEEPVESLLNRVAEQLQPKRKLLLWDIVRGWSDNGADKWSVMDGLSRIAKSPEDVLFVLRDLHPVLKNPQSRENAPIVRESE